MRVFDFHQNNAGGVFQEGMPQVLFVLAESAVDANLTAEANGVVFNVGCECCGDRWVPAPRESVGLNFDEYLEAITACDQFGWTRQLVFSANLA